MKWLGVLLLPLYRMLVQCRLAPPPTPSILSDCPDSFPSQKFAEYLPHSPRGSFPVLIYSQLLPCGHFTISDTPLLETGVEVPVKLELMRITSTRCCQFPLLRTPNCGSEGVRCRRSWLSIPGWRQALRKPSVLPKNTTPSFDTDQELNLDQEFNMLTIRSPHFPFIRPTLNQFSSQIINRIYW